MLTRVTQEKEILESTIATLNAQIEALKIDCQNSVETSAKALVDQRAELEQQHKDLVLEMEAVSEKEQAAFQQKLQELEQQIWSDKARESLEQSEQVIALEQELSTVRGEMHHKKEEMLQLEKQLQSVQVDNTRLSTLEVELQKAQSSCDSLENALRKVRTEWSDAQSSWDMEREMPDTEQAQQEHHTDLFASMEKELQTVREQRSQLLETIDMLTAVQRSKDQSIHELQGTADDVVVQLQEERDEAQTELEMLRLEMGIAQSTARQLAQQAERMRRDVLKKQALWSQKLTQKEAENNRLRAKLNSVDRGLSSLFVQRPVF
jgi:chromosome segregation ATPase